MKKIFFIVVFLLSCSILQASSFKITIGGSGNEYAVNTIETSDKGFLIVGYTTSGSAIGEDGLAVKTDKNGNVLWSKIFSNSGNERINGCAELDNSYYLVGQTTSATIGGQDAWCLKLDTAGGIIWSKKFGTTGADGFHKLRAISSSSLILCGYSGGSNGEQLAYAYAVKINTSGNVLFEKKYGTGFSSTQTNAARNLALTNFGDVIMSCYTYCFGAGLHDGMMVCIDTVSGNRLWTKSYGSTNNDVLNSITNSKDGNFICSGYDRLNGAIDTKFWVMKINDQGNSIWQKSFYHNASNVNFIGAISTAEDNGFISVVNTNTPSGSTVAEFLRMDSIGNPLWVRTINELNLENFSTVLTTSDSNYIATGYTNSLGAGGYDIFVVKLDRFGNIENCCVKSGSFLMQQGGMVVSLQNQDVLTNSSQTIYSNTVANFNVQKNINCIPVPATGYVNAFVCDGASYVLPSGQVVSQPGSYSSLISNSSSCDSVVITNLSVSSSYFDTLDISICSGTSYVLPNGSSVSNTGVYPVVFNSINGCDSTIITNLNVTSQIFNTLSYTICSGSSFVLPWGGTVAVAGVYSDTVLSFGGCDSITSISLLVSNSITSTINASICNGNSYYLPDSSSVSTSGTYVTVLTTASGCDSVITTNLSLQSITSYIQTVQLCQGEVYLSPGGQLIQSSGIYVDTLLTNFGCDSVISTNVLFISEMGLSKNIPNVFTPNGDGKNDLFKVGEPSSCIELYSIQIFNRWGQKIFASDDLFTSWDGKINGENAVDGLYFYLISYKRVNGVEEYHNGTVTLLR